MVGLLPPREQVQGPVWDEGVEPLVLSAGIN